VTINCSYEETFHALPSSASNFCGFKIKIFHDFLSELTFLTIIEKLQNKAYLKKALGK
jgi:hypothetical protein